MGNKTPPDLPLSAITREDYRALSEFRYLLRRFLEFSQKAARGVGLQPRQHQAILAIKGFPEDRSVTIGDLAERLRILHHSAVELVDRLCEAELVVREPDPEDQRRVFLVLTDKADDFLARLSHIHLDELSRIGPLLKRIPVRENNKK
ncbi:MarR family transcriptional regulator [Mesorhizobium sp. Root157]|uniref:MarR family winged helix-turn-helix transcriptional regulator n=1 Tax=Mesorhizobium sp. Root157 TaxID=1736477 RepID=UPI0006FA30A2|nr:helix-turn-helix domain-containing protein [Mesorhizobium sp. Root157]KQZ98486.1 MarR family transcriptional regulator [Mesorhizobium sp. Root157]